MYKTRIALDDLNGDMQLRPGMNASVEIIVDLMEDVIAVPLPGVQRSGSTHYVWKWSESGPIAVQVQIGRNNLTHVHIVSGLQEGEVIYLASPEGIDPPEFAGEIPASRPGVSIADPSSLGQG